MEKRRYEASEGRDMSIDQYRAGAGGPGDLFGLICKKTKQRETFLSVQEQIESKRLSALCDCSAR